MNEREKDDKMRERMIERKKDKTKEKERESVLVLLFSLDERIIEVQQATPETMTRPGVGEEEGGKTHSSECKEKREEKRRE